MKETREETYRKVFINSEADLPKEDGKYFTHSTMTKGRLIECTLNDLIIGNGVYDWYLLPVTDKEATTEQEKPQTAEKERLLLAEEILDKVLDQLKGGSYFLYTTKTRSMVITAMEEYATQKHIPTDCYPKEFVEWCIEAVDTEERAEVDYCYAVWDSHNVLGFDTIDELYQYYLNNVKDK